MRIPRRKLSQRIINASLAFVLALSSVTASLPFVFSQSANADTGDTYIVNRNYDVDCSDFKCNSLHDAVDAASAGDTIKIVGNLSIHSQVTVNKEITIDGMGGTNNHKAVLWGEFNKTSHGNNSVIGLQAPAVIKNLVIDGKNRQLHGINAWHTNGDALVWDTTLRNLGMSGLNVGELAQVTAGNLTTSNNGWHGIDVDKVGSVLTIKGVNSHTDVLPIYVDDVNLGQVIDVDNKYGYRNDRIKLGDRVYSLKLAAPELLSPSNNGYTTDDNFYFDWKDVDGAVGYEFVNSKVNGEVDANGKLLNPHFTGTSTDSELYSSGAGEVTRWWQVRAIDTNGIKGNWSSAWKMTIDMTTPDAPVLTSPADGGVMKGASVTQSWSDASSDVDHYIYESYNDASATSLRWHEVFSGTSKTATNVADSTYWWRVKAVDAAGNESAWSPLWKVVVDNKAPVVTFEGYVQNDNVITPNFTASDANGPLTYSWTTNPDVTLSATDELNPTFTVDADGDYTFTLTVTDAAGNSEDATFNFTYTAPVAPVDNGDETPVENDNDGFTDVTFDNVDNGDQGEEGTETPEEEVAGESDDKSKDILGTSTDKDGTWNIIGLAWYWWIVILAALAALARLLVVLKKRRNGEA